MAVALVFVSSADGNVVVATESSTGTAFPGTAWASSVSATDLINNGRTTFSNAVVGATNTSFPASGLNDGASANAVPGGNTFFQPAHFTGSGGTTTVTFNLNVAANTQGYDITSLQSFMGWQGIASQIQANQTYTVAFSLVGSASYTDIATVSYLPFADVNGNHYESHVTLTDGNGILASWVDSIRFTFRNPLSSVTDGAGATEGTLIREIDVHGYPTGSGPELIAVLKPAARQVVQRSPANTGTVQINGTCVGTPATIEARMVVMPGTGNHGTDTPWSVVATAPSGGVFSGVLSAVAAGGWYQLEVRPITAGTPGNSTTVQRIGVGDVYVTCGQSNAANYGSPPFTNVNDLVSAWNYSGGVWTRATDPMPGAGGAGGSVWTRLGELLVTRNQVPVAFACLGLGSTSVSQWVPPNRYYPRITSAVKAFPANGFRAVLWHQGESDSLATTSAADYQKRMQSIIARSRLDAGWEVPWYISEVGFHPSSKLAQEEPVVAGQRAVIYADSQVFSGPVTDDFHLESKFHDGVHFNASGLADHAGQWDAILAGDASLGPKNGDFESNSALADGALAVIDTTVNTSPSVIGWRALAADGSTVADGSCGYANPNDSWYPGTGDSVGGVISGMAGRHIAFLAGSAGNAQFLQTRRAMVKGGTTYTLRISLGVRANSDTFGGAQIELLADAAPLKNLSVTKADLDALHSGNAAGTFTEVSLQFVTPLIYPEGKALSIRIRKTSGAETYLDFDNVRLESKSTPFTSWQTDRWDDAGTSSPWDAEPDGVGLANGIEYQMGLNLRFNEVSRFLTLTEGESSTWIRYRIPIDPLVPNPGLGLW